MSDKERTWKYAEDIIVESETIQKARTRAVELGIDPISAAIGAQSAVIAAASGASHILEIGTGIGVSGLWLLSGSPRSVLTSIDTELDLQQHARSLFAEAGVSSNRVRLITGNARDVLPRMNENSYDVVFVDADVSSVIEYVEHGLRLARPGGTVLVPHALWRGRVADPTKRDETVSAFRSLVHETAGSPAVISALSMVGDGLLQITKSND